MANTASLARNLTVVPLEDLPVAAFSPRDAVETEECDCSRDCFTRYGVRLSVVVDGDEVAHVFTHTPFETGGALLAQHPGGSLALLAGVEICDPDTGERRTF